MLKGFIRANGSLQSSEEALNEAALFGHIDNYPLPIIVRMIGESRPSTPTASQIAGGAYRRTVLERIIDFYSRPDSIYAMLRGTLIHAGLQNTNIDGVKMVTEKRFSYTIPETGISISGQVDVYYPSHNRLEDYKTCKRIPDYINDTHAFQLAVYAWLLRWNGYAVDSAAIDYISWDEARQMRLAEMPDGTLNEVIMHPFFKDESYFIEVLTSIWDMLNDGFTANIVPSMSDCQINYCRHCPVKWACDMIKPGGDVINPAEFKQMGSMVL